MEGSSSTTRIFGAIAAQDNRSGLAAIAVLCALAGCALRPSAIAPLGPGSVAGALALEEPARVAVVADDRAEVAADVIAWDPHLVLLLEAVPRSTTEAWRALGERWGPLARRLVPVVGPGDRRGDRRLRGLAAAFPAAGVPELDGAFGHLDLVHDGARWRVVLLDPDPPSWPDELLWLPKVVGDDGYDHLLLAAGAPLPPSLTALADDHAAPGALLATVSPGGGADTPLGPYGPVHLGVGPGWWRLLVDGHELELVHRVRTPAGWHDRASLRATVDAGWIRGGD